MLLEGEKKLKQGERGGEREVNEVNCKVKQEAAPVHFVAGGASFAWARVCMSFDAWALEVTVAVRAGQGHTVHGSVVVL